MTNNQTDKKLIPLFALGDMRALNIKVPAHLDAHSNEYVMGLPRDAALELAQSVLTQWKVSPEEGAAFLAEIEDEVLSDVLVIYQLMEVLFVGIEPSAYMQASNEYYKGRKPWHVIQEGESLDLRKYLEYMVFSGGW